MEVQEFLKSHAHDLMIQGDKYYRGDTDILKRERKIINEHGKLEVVKHLPNNRISSNPVRTLVDQKTGYLLSNPMSLQTEDERYRKLLESYWNEELLATFGELGEEAVNKGVAWLQVYYNEDGEFAYKVIPSEEVLPFWRDRSHKKLEAVAHVYKVEEYLGPRKVITTKVDYWDLTGVKRYIYENGSLRIDSEQPPRGHFTVIEDGKETPLVWERLPFIAFKYNKQELCLLTWIKSLVDAYDVLTSDIANALEESPHSAILIIKDYGNANLGEFRRNLMTYNAVKVTTGVNGDAGVDSLQVEVNAQNYAIVEQVLRKTIIKSGRGVDTDDLGGSNLTNLNIQAKYADLDSDCDKMETQFQVAIQQFLWFVDTHLANTGQGDYYGTPVTVIFNRDTMINETEAISNCVASVGIISDETIVENHPWVKDVSKELERLRKQREERMDQYANSFPQKVADEREE